MDAWTFDVEGAEVYGEHHPCRGTPRANVVFLHGFNSCTREFRDAPADFADAGFNALAFDQRGFGRSGGARGWTSRGRALVELGHAVDQMEDHNGELPLYLVGHSLGAAYALAALAEGTRFQAAVVAHPVRRLMDEVAPAARLAYHALGRLSRRRLRRGGPPGHLPYRARYEHLFVDEQAVAWARRQHFLSQRIDLRSYEVAHSMDAAAWAAQASVPVLGIMSRHDRVVRPKSSQSVLESTPTLDGIVWHEGGHSCFGDVERHEVTQAAVAFLTDQQRRRR